MSEHVSKPEALHASRSELEWRWLVSLVLRLPDQAFAVPFERHAVATALLATVRRPFCVGRGGGG